MDGKSVENMFIYHPPKGDQIKQYQTIRDAGGNFAMLLQSQIPDSEEKTIAIQKIREAVMWANAAIACNQ